MEFPEIVCDYCDEQIDLGEGYISINLHRESWKTDRTIEIDYAEQVYSFHTRCFRARFLEQKETTIVLPEESCKEILKS